MKRLILGVDPGLTGAISIIDIDAGNALVDVEDMPLAGGAVTAPLLADMLGRIGPEGIAAVVIEQVHSMPKQGVASSFKFGQSYGVVLGFFGAYLPVIHAVPTVWKSHFRLNGKGKDAARALAIERWPLQARILARKKDADRADAALIGLWGAETAPVVTTPAFTLHV